MMILDSSLTGPSFIMVRTLFPPSRAAALGRLSQFTPRAAQPYANGRNTDPGPDHQGAVSKLSPYLRHRLVTEQDVVSQVLAEHSLTAADMFIQEVLWRTYWKGWLEMRPSVWRRFLEERDQSRESFPNQRAILAAEQGLTGIDCFDHWARELVETGYLHNHARMWFASIWIFTLRLPWTLGADFFLRHLLDADAASNTLSWRWVAGLQTAGKTYLATPENISRFTNGRFAPKGLAQEAVALSEEPVGAAKDLRSPPAYDRSKPALLLITHEDMHPESIFAKADGVASAVFANDRDLLWGDAARNFIAACADETATRVSAHFGCRSEVIAKLDADVLLEAARKDHLKQIVTAYAPVGPVADKLAQLAPALAAEGVALVEVRRQWDSAFWPHAKKGFFPFKAQIPTLLHEMGLA
jgi:deoxyribodipyrimidine photo-lyase